MFMMFYFKKKMSKINEIKGTMERNLELSALWYVLRLFCHQLSFDT